LIYKTVKSSLARIWVAEGEKPLLGQQESLEGWMVAVRNAQLLSSSMCQGRSETRSMNALVACQSSTSTNY